ncbi:MAG: SRPBCC family protein, partial [Pseudomonadota bacterium]
ETSGRLKEARGCPSLNGKVALNDLPCRDVGGLVYVWLRFGLQNDVFEPAIVDSLSTFGLATAKEAAQITYTANVNWKLWVENFLECLHCHTAHPQLSSVEDHISAFEAGNYQGFFISQSKWQAEAIGRGWRAFPNREANSDDAVFQFIETLHLGIARQHATKSGEAAAEPLADGTASFSGGLVYGALSPFLHFSITADHAVIFQFRPVSAEKTDIVIRWYTRNGECSDTEDLTWLWSNTIRQDIALTENVQINMTSRNLPRGLYTKDESRTEAFSTWVRRRMMRTFNAREVT